MYARDLPLLLTVGPDPLPSHFPCRPHVLPLPANNCSWLIAAPIAAKGSEGLCFLPGQACNLWDPQVFPLPAAVPADLGCHSGESWLGWGQHLAQRMGVLAWMWVAAVGQVRKVAFSQVYTASLGKVQAETMCSQLHCPFSLMLITGVSFQILFPWGKASPAAWSVCSGSLVTSSSQCFVGGQWHLG